MRSLHVLAGSALLAMLAACGSDADSGTSSSGTPAASIPASTAAPTSAAVSPTPGRPTAPKVTTAKNATGKSPCDLVPAATISAIGLGAGKLTPGAQGADKFDTCRWVGTGSNWMKTLIVSVNTKSGLESTYNNRAIFTEFIESQVAGQPAVRANQGDALAGCNLYVGLSDTQTLWVIGNAGTKESMDQHCVISTQTAEAIIKALP